VFNGSVFSTAEFLSVSNASGFRLNERCAAHDLDGRGHVADLQFDVHAAHVVETSATFSTTKL
jgi:hypothetical protein